MSAKLKSFNCRNTRQMLATKTNTFLLYIWVLVLNETINFNQGGQGTEISGNLDDHFSILGKQGICQNREAAISVL